MILDLRVEKQRRPECEEAETPWTTLRPTKTRPQVSEHAALLRHQLSLLPAFFLTKIQTWTQQNITELCGKGAGLRPSVPTLAWLTSLLKVNNWLLKSLRSGDGYSWTWMVLCPPRFKDLPTPGGWEMLQATALGSEGQTKLWRVMSLSLWKERFFRLSVEGVNNGLIQLEKALRETGNMLQDANDKAARRQAAARQTSEFIRRWYPQLWTMFGFKLKHNSVFFK